MHAGAPSEQAVSPYAEERAAVTRVSRRDRRAFADRHVVVTGASDGIGRELALQLAACGARVSLAARRQDKLAALAKEIQDLGGRAAVVVADVGVEAECRALVDQAIVAHGDIDILVCCAGISLPNQTIDRLTTDVMRRTFDVNYMGAVWVIIAALPSLKRKRGMIVGISSAQGLIPFPDSLAYSPSKHALQGFLDCLRVDLGEALDVLSVSPGPVATNIHPPATDDGRMLDRPKMYRQSMSVRTCARLIRTAMRRRRRDLVMTPSLNLAAKLYPFFPNFVDWAVAKATRRFYARALIC